MMRSLATAAVLLAAAVLHVAPAAADVGPPPSCPAGKHREYLYGHKCVTDGFHLEPMDNGGAREVADAPAPSASATAAASSSTAAGSTAAPSAAASEAVPGPTGSAAAPPPVTSSPAPGPEAPPPKRGCACGLTGSAGGAGNVRIASVALLGGLLTFASRRRARRDARRRE
ncbi:MAG: hypothetical protein HY908_27120 [Myxococcales bacterium]|nr:hypothetical protein [Myxococcales bacterium]